MSRHASKTFGIAVRMRLDHMRTAIAAQRPGTGLALLTRSTRQRLTLAALTLNRSAACPWVRPSSSTATTARRLRSGESAMNVPASLLIRRIS